MGVKSRMKRERRAYREYAASLTTCEGTWLEHAPDSTEQQRIRTASKALKEHRKLAIAFHHDPTEANLYSLELFRNTEFQLLHLEDWLIERIIKTIGEPPVIEEGDEAVFSAYLRKAVLYIATPNIRRAIAGQLRRYLPKYTEAERWKEAVALDYNIFLTALGNEVSPFLAQMTLEGLARWYDMYEEEEEAEAPDNRNAVNDEDN